MFPEGKRANTLRVLLSGTQLAWSLQSLWWTGFKLHRYIFLPCHQLFMLAPCGLDFSIRFVMYINHTYYLNSLMGFFFFSLHFFTLFQLLLDFWQYTWHGTVISNRFVTFFLAILTRLFYFPFYSSALGHQTIHRIQ